MGGRDHSLAFALCASLVAHTGLVLVLTGQSSAIAPPKLQTPLPQSDPSPIYVAQVMPPSTDLVFGDSRGTGDAANSAPGDEPLRAKSAEQPQAFLSRDPVGPGHVGDDPSMSVLPQGAASDADDPPAVPQGEFGVAKTPETAAAPRARRSPNRPADPAIMSDSESDPFARGDSIEFRDGAVEVRFGRKVRTVRPKLSLAGYYDLVSRQFPKMIVRLHVDRAGDVRQVEIVQSTGSEAADQAVKVALYQWWIEPPKDKSGAAVADVVQFPIIWR